MRKTMLLTVLLGSLALVGPRPASASEGPVVSDPDGRSRLELTVYNRNLALVRDLRTVTVPAGEFRLEFRGVPEQIRPTTLLVDAGGRTGLEVLEQNYEYDLMSRDKILEKYVGHDLTWIQEDSSRITGRLLGMAAGPVYEVDGEIVFEVPGRIALPRLPENLRARPTLVWRTTTDRGGAADLDVSYLTGGLGWSADYVLQLDQAGERADLQGWVSVENRSGATFEDATLMLVAGEINQVAPDRIKMAEMAMEAPQYRRGGNQVQEETLYDYHLYTVPWSTTFTDNSTKQVSLLEATDVAVERIYTTRAPAHWFRSRTAGPQPQDVAVSYALENREDNGLGVPMPAGVVRVYGRSAAGGRQLLGEDRIDHTPKDERIELEVGTAFDLVAERLQTDYSKIGDRVHRMTYEITLRNHKDEDVTIHVEEMVGGDWEVLRSSHDYEKLGATALEFAVQVPQDGETTVTYTVQVTY